MDAISIFEIFKIGVGPSSSHTLGPWRAAEDFVNNLKGRDCDTIMVHLYGSLSKTGKGHATDVAVMLGLMGHDPVTIDTSRINEYLDAVHQEKSISINGSKIQFDPKENIIFELNAHILHPNTLILQAYHNGLLIQEQTYASVGGGFIEKAGEETSSETVHTMKLPYPIQKGADILRYTSEKECSISDIVMINERAYSDDGGIIQKVDDLLETMLDCVYRGCTTEGTLPGGLNVQRRASQLCKKMTDGARYNNRDEWMDAISDADKDFNRINKWVSCFALAVNEENASLGKVVTSPTNGAAGVIPAVLLYYYFFCDYDGKDSVRKFLFTAGEVGCLFKKGATISAAVGGCQAEIGVSSAMAAAGLTEVLGGTPQQALMAAEIAMEHHLGLTCDPIGGLVQIPCIERNAMGAMKAITASNLALTGDPGTALIDIDTVIKTMWETAQDMNHKYKETAEGGLAINLPVFLPNC